jgi:hypothetical protein
MITTLRHLLCLIAFTTLIWGKSFAGTEPYENFLKGQIKQNDTLVVKDEKFKNALFNWSEITNISVKNTISLRVIDEQLISKDFSCKMVLKVEYFSTPSQHQPISIDSVSLNVNYIKQGGALYRNLDTYKFNDGYYVKITVLNVNSPEFGDQMPPVLQLSSNILIERKYLFKSGLYIGLNGQVNNGSGGSAQRLTGGSPVNGGNQLALLWPAIQGAEEFDLEWVVIDEDSEWTAIANNMQANSGTLADDDINQMFRNNATRITTVGHDYTISLVFNAKYIAVRIRQVQYALNGLRLEGNWIYKQDSNNNYAIWTTNWHQPNLNWQYSASYAEDGKKKEVISYFDGSLRGRQTVTISNTDSVAVVQENVYDQFGRAAASILPAPVKLGTESPYLHYFSNFNQNVSGKAYSYLDLNAVNCEPLPSPLGLSSGAAQYYSGQNQFLNLKNYNKYIPDAEGYPLSLTQYTADNTGRIKIQGGVGRTFQPDTTGQSKTTKYYYGKPYQWELDRIFGNDAGYAEHYLKNMVVDPNGQISVSYLNAGGKTVATALTGKSPANVDSLALNPSNSLDRLEVSKLLKPDQFKFDASALKLSATTTYLAGVTGVDTLKYSIEKLISRYPGGAFKPCSNCYYDLTILVKNDCGAPIYTTTSAIQIGSVTADSTNVGLHRDSVVLNFDQIGEYYISFEFALSKNVIENFTNKFIKDGQSNGAVKKQENFILQYLRNSNFNDCFSDCKNAVARLGTKTDFITMFNNKIKSLSDTTTADLRHYDIYIDSLYDQLMATAITLQNNCDNTQPSPCDTYKTAMLEDVSPGGQYALFDVNGSAKEVATNQIFLHFKHGAFDDLSPTDTLLRPATLVTRDDGSGSFSPYDAGVSVADLIKYWKPEWAEQFLKFHPEYCKLEFCIQNSASAIWDNKIAEIDETSQLAAKIPGLVFSRTNSTFLLDTDPFFKTGATGASYYPSMKADLEDYSRRILGQYVASSKSLSLFVDFQLYCSDTTATSSTNLSNLANYWDNCQPDPNCRVENREWQLYRNTYAQLKMLYFQKARSESTQCLSSCNVSEPLAIIPVIPTPSDCVYDGPTENSNKAIALQKLSDVLDSNTPNAIEMWMYGSSYSSRQFIAATPDKKYMMQACFNGQLLSVDIFSINQSDSAKVGIVLSNHVAANVSSILPLSEWLHVVVQGTNLAKGNLEIWINGKKFTAITGPQSAGCAWGISSNPLNLPENFSALDHLRLYSGRNMTKSEIEENAASQCFLASNHNALNWYRFKASDTPTPTCTPLAFFFEVQQLSSTQFRETNELNNTRKTYTFISGNINEPIDPASYCANGSVQVIFRPCIDVYMAAVPIRFNNVWEVICTENLDGSCSGVSSGVLYAEGSGSGNYYLNTVGYLRDVYTVIEGNAPDNAPPLVCGPTGNGYQTFFNCYTVKLGGQDINYSNVWVNVCQGEYFDPGMQARGIVAKIASVNQVQRTTLLDAVKENINRATVKAEVVLANLFASKKPTETILSDFTSKEIYFIAANNTATLKKPVAPQGFSPAVLKSSFVLKTGKGSYNKFKNVYVATFIPQDGSAKNRQDITLNTLSSNNRQTFAAKKKSSSQLMSSIIDIQGTIAVCASLIDQDYGTEPTVCMGGNFDNSIRRTTLMLVDNNGQPATLANNASVVVRYDDLPGNNFGLPPSSFTVNITVPAGQSFASFEYNSRTYADEGLGSCVADQKNFACIESITGASFCTTVTNCNGVIINPGGGTGDPVSCPDSLKFKISRFIQIGETDISTIDTATASANSKVLLLNQYRSAAVGQAENWINSLAVGLQGYDPSIIQALKDNLIELCIAASDIKHPFGASTLPAGKTIVVNGIACTNFGEVIKAVLNINNFTDVLNPWLISAPYPFETIHQATEITVSKTSPGICALLASENPSNLTPDDFYASLKSRYGNTMNLSLVDFKILLKGCNQCRFLLDKDLILPSFLQPGTKGCMSRATYIAQKDSLTNILGVQQNWSNYETILSNYLNHKWGFSFTYDQYKAFEDGTDVQLCNIPPYTSVDEDSYSCSKILIEIAYGYGTRDYKNYIIEEREKFVNAYISTCAAANPEVSLAARQKIYHYTLYYYDLAGNLVRTVPPEGVAFLNDAEMNYAQKVRQQSNVTCPYNGPAPSTDEVAALNALSATVGNNGINAMELWTYSDLSGSRQFIATTPDLKYMVQACQNGNLLNVDIFTLNQTAPDNVSITLSNHVTADLRGASTLSPWTHIVVQGQDFATGNLQIWINGKQHTPVAGGPSAGCAWDIFSNPISMPKNFAALKHLRLYSGRLMTQSEIEINAANSCLNPSDTTSMAWFRFNIPNPGDETTIAYNSTQETQYSGVFPDHVLTTTYAYNATNQVVKQYTPDSKTSKFWYDNKSRLII